MTAGTLWRFVDKLGNDMVSPGSFTMRFNLADNSTVTANAAVVVDNAIVEASGATGAQMLADGGAGLADASRPAVTALSDGAFAIAWRSGGAVHARQVSAWGALLGEEPQQGGGAAIATAMVQPASLDGSAGSNVFELTGGEQHGDGQGGLDTVVYHGARAGFSVARQGDGFGVDDQAGANGHDTLLNIERIRFSDGAVALDLGGAAGQACRLYQAAFDRTPDLAGLGYWIAQMDRGLALNDAAAAFSSSKEFVQMYGAHSTDAQFVDLLCQNVLHRPPVTLSGWSRLAPATWRAKPCSGYSAKASRTRGR